MSVSFCNSFSAILIKSSAIPSFLSFRKVSRASRLAFLMDILACSAICCAFLTRFFLVSSVRGGKASISCSPSLVGVTPMSAASIAFSSGSSAFLSQGLTTSVLASLTLMEAICLIGMLVP